MRNIKIGLIAILCVIAVCLCGVLIYGITGHDIYNYNSISYNEMKLVYEEETELEGIEDISILYGMNSTDIFLYESDSDKVQIKEYSGYELKDEEVSTVTIEGGRLTIKGKRKKRFSFMFGYCPGSYAEVWIPSSYSGELHLETSSGSITAESDINLKADFSAESSSGDMNIASVSAASATISSSSGNITVKEISAGTDDKEGEINVSASSGDMFLGQLTGETSLASSSGVINVDAITGNARCSSSSGDINIQSVNGNIETSTSSGCVTILAGNGDRNVSTSSGDIELKGTDRSFSAKTSSGEVHIEAKEGCGSIETTSGDIRLEILALAGDLNIDSSSGAAYLTLPEVASFDFRAKTSSGDINTYFDDNLNFSKKGNSAQGTCGSNTQGYLIEISTTSGDIQIKSAR